jgi:phospholipid-binding lipoprotein MlaA
VPRLPDRKTGPGATDVLDFSFQTVYFLGRSTGGEDAASTPGRIVAWKHGQAGHDRSDAREEEYWFMNRQGWSRFILFWATLSLAVVLTGTGPVPSGADTSFAEDRFMTEQSEPLNEGVAEFDSLSEGEDADDFSAFDEFEGDADSVFDPLSGYNRVMTRVNDRLYFWVMKPVARGYKAVVAEPIRMSIGRFFRNLGFPVRLVNNLLQLKLKPAGTETLRFAVNTTIGIAGLWDPATTMMELPAYEEDFGQTLGHYGLGAGFHIVLPLFGPSNVRDTCGRITDWFLDPVHYLEDSEARAAVNAVRMINGTSLRLGQYEAMTQDSMDLYILLRDSYENNRNKNIGE